MAHYVDTSALVKLVVAEAETAALRSWALSGDRDLVTSDLTRTELMRVARRGAPNHAVQARAVLDAMILIQVSTDVFESAARLDPIELRSLDALHLAAALEVGDDLDGLVTYDERQAAGARALGITVIAPR